MLIFNDIIHFLVIFLKIEVLFQQVHLVNTRLKNKMSLAYQQVPIENGGESKTTTLANTSVTVPSLLLSTIAAWAKTESHNIHKEKTYNRNMSFAFGNMGGFGEEVAMLMYPDALGSASKGGCAFDVITEWDENFKTTKAKEVKTVCLNGTKECTNCGLKAPAFQTKCLKCNNEDFKEKKDSRAGIDAKAHDEYARKQLIIDEYLIIVSDCSENTLKGTLKCFKIKSDNPYFNAYTLNQLENGSNNTCNLLPYSYDFYASGPIKVFEFELDFNTLEVDVNYYNPNNEAIENLPTKVLTKKQKKFYNIDEKQTVIEYSKIESQLTLKNKSLGRNRGKIVRN